MKVLWFSLSPCSSTKRFGKEKLIQGWMISLENAIKHSISLEIAYASDREEAPFDYEGVRYYPIFLKGKSIKDKFKNIYGSQADKDKELLPLLKNTIEQSNPDIVHIHGTESFFCSVTKAIIDKPIVYSIQGFLAPIAEQYFAGFPLSELKKHDTLKSRLLNKSTIAKYNKFLYDVERERVALESADNIIGRTKWDCAISRLYNPNASYYTVNEILRPPFYIALWEKEAFNKRLTIISTLSPGVYKGYETLLKAAALLKRYASFEFEWRVIGCTNNSTMVKTAEEMTGLNSANCNIRLLGMKNAEELAQELKAADLYCHTSHIENSPNSVCEAMILGMPVIATFVGGTDSMLEHEKEGILYQDGDSYALAAYIVYMRDNFENAAAMGKKARERALKRHDKQQIVNDLLTIYKKIQHQQTLPIPHRYGK
jgi:glycosyltransferase involved in cell wall biosynthesis